jgi:hypothetical protein
MAIKISDQLKQQLSDTLEAMGKYQIYPGAKSVVISMVNAVFLDGRNPTSIPLEGIFLLAIPEDVEKVRKLLVAFWELRNSPS